MADRQLATVKQGADERIAYGVDTTGWGGTPTSVVVTLKSYALGAYTDVSSTNLNGSAVVASNTITTPIVHSLTAGTQYRLEVQFVSAGNTLECFKFIEAEL